MAELVVEYECELCKCVNCPCWRSLDGSDVTAVGGAACRCGRWVNFNNPSALYGSLSFWVNGGGATRQLRAYTHPDDSPATSVMVNFTAPANTWTQIIVPLSAFGNPSVITRVTVQDRSGSAQSNFYIDEMVFGP